MKPFFLMAVISLIAQILSCEPQKKENLPRPDLCVLLNDYPKNSESLGQMPVRDLIVLQRCGMKYYPHLLFGGNIARSREYPVPELLAALKSSGDDEFRIELINILIQVAQSENHSEAIRKDRQEVLSTVDRALNTMEDRGFKELGTKDRQRLESALE